MPENNGNQYSKSLIKTNIKKHIDKFRKPFRTYLDKDAVCNFINNLIEESKYSTEVIKTHFNKELAMTKKENADFQSSTKCWICDNDYVDNGVIEALHIKIVITMLN